MGSERTLAISNGIIVQEGRRVVAVSYMGEGGFSF